MTTGGKFPYTVNFFSFCGHGALNEKKETLFIVPITPRDGGKALFDERFYKFINIEQIATKFSEKEHSLNIFLVSACRTKLNDWQTEQYK